MDYFAVVMQDGPPVSLDEGVHIWMLLSIMAETPVSTRKQVSCAVHVHEGVK